MSGAEFPVTYGLSEPFGYGPVYQDFLPLTNPAAGSTLSFVVPANVWLRVLAARATLTTDANAANRFFSLDFITARGTTYLRNAAGLVVVANTTNLAFEWTEQRGDAQWATNTPVLLPVSSIWLPPATTVRFQVDNIQVGDAITSASLTVEKSDTGATGLPIGFTAPGAE